MKLSIHVPNGNSVPETIWVTLKRSESDTWQVVGVQGEVLDEGKRNRLLEIAVAFAALNIEKLTVTLAT